jgi:hypothetical protein
MISLCLLPLCLTKLALEAKNSWTCEKLCQKAEEYVRKCLELNSDFSPAILELSRIAYARSFWVETTEQKVREVVQALALIANANDFSGYDLGIYIDLTRSFKKTTLNMLKVLTDSLQSALVGVYFELPGSQDDKFVSTLVESSLALILQTKHFKNPYQRILHSWLILVDFLW